MKHSLRVHEFLPLSHANGPGRRAVVWVQGCTLGCPGCYNPETHARTGGELVAVDELVSEIAALGDSIEGLTISGGEPLQQMTPLLELLRRIKEETGLSILLFTGYTMEEIRKMTDGDAVLECVDVLIAGRYDETQWLAHELRGSANKTVHFLTDRYAPDDLAAVPAAEVLIDSDGSVILSGIDPMQWGQVTPGQNCLTTEDTGEHRGARRKALRNGG